MSQGEGMERENRDGSADASPAAARPKYKYEIAKYGHSIKRVEYTKETDKTVTLVTSWAGKKSERRAAKNTDYSKYFDSELEAVQHLIVRTSLRLDACKRETNAENSALHQLQKRLRILMAEGPAKASEAGTQPLPEKN